MFLLSYNYMQVASYIMIGSFNVKQFLIGKIYNKRTTGPLPQNPVPSLKMFWMKRFDWSGK